MPRRSMSKSIQALQKRIERMVGKGHEESREKRTREPILQINESELRLGETGKDLEAFRKAVGETEQSPDEYRDWYDQIPAGCITLNEQGLILDLNPGASNMLGGDEEDLINANLELFFHPNYRDAFGLHLRKVLNSKTNHACEVVIRKKDNTVIDAQIVSVARPINGRLIVRNVVTEIADRRRAEQELQEAVGLLRAVVAGAPDAVYVKDRRGRYILCNPQAARLIQREVAEVMGKDDLSLLPPDRARTARESDRSVMASGTATTYEETFVFGGAEKTYLTTKRPLFDDRGVALGVFSISRDITSFKVTQRALIDGETRLRTSLTNAEKLNRELRHKAEELDTIFHTAPVGIAVSYDPQCLHIKGNATYAAMLGLTPRDNLSKTAPPGERPRGFKEMQDGRQLLPRELPMQVAAFKGRVVSNIEIDLVHDGGRVVHVLGNTKPLFDEHGKPRGAVGVFLDITELKKTQEDLSKAHRKIAKILESITDAFISLDGHWRYTYVNEAACRLLRRSREELLGQRALATFPEAARLRFHTEFVRAKTERTPVHFEEFLPPLDAWYECRCYPSSEGLSVYFQDITERKKAEEERKHHIARLDTLLEVSRDVLAASSSEDMLQRVVGAARTLTGARFVASAHGDDTGRFRDGVTSEAVGVCRQEQGRLFPKEPEEAMDRVGFKPAWDQNVRVKDHPAWWTIQGRAPGRTLIGAEVHTNGTPEELIMVSGKKNGEFTPEDQTVLTQLAAVASLGLRHIEAKNDVELVVQERTAELRKAYESLNLEMQERKKAERQLRHAQKMDALGTMADGIGHDFNNILAAIIGFTQLVYDHLPAENAERPRLQRVLEAGLRGRELVAQMLTFARADEREKKAVQPEQVIEETLKLLKPSIPATIDVRVSLRNTSGFVLGNPAQLGQVVVNLCNNATHAMRKSGGVLDIELTDFTAEGADGPAALNPGEYLKLTVGDTGVGIRPEHIDKVFDPFFTTNRSAAGLGLSVVHGIVGQTGGHITVESRPGKGSVFTVYLPKILHRRGIATGREPIPTGREQILFVDDEEWLVETGKSLLEGLGYRVTATTSSAKALEIFLSDPYLFDLVVTDQTMPSMTGLELAGRMTEARPGLPVVLITGFSYVIDNGEAERSGITAFAMKPLMKAEIAEIVRSALDRSVHATGRRR